jgi:hypothetical protein
MQRIGFQRFAAGGLRDPLERSRAKKIDYDRSDNDDKRRDRGFDRMRLRADQPPRRFEHHNRGQQEQQRSLGKGSDAFDFAVAVLMFGIGGFAGNAHREIGQDRGGEVEQRVPGFGQNGKRAGEQTDNALCRRQSRRRGDRAQRGPFLFIHAALARFSRCRMDQFCRFDNFAMRWLHDKESRVLQIDRRFSVAPMMDGFRLARFR